MASGKNERGIKEEYSATWASRSTDNTFWTPTSTTPGTIVMLVSMEVVVYKDSVQPTGEYLILTNTGIWENGS